MKLGEVYRSAARGLSFELFPPKTPEGESALLHHVEQLMRFGPHYITCTYGAGGSTRDRTLRIVQQVKQRFQVPVASHLTCVESTIAQLSDYLTEAAAAEVDAIVALRGDPPQGQTTFQSVDGGLAHANELVALIHERFPKFGIAVAGYPETHRESPDWQTDVEHLRRKVDAGADVVITQLFYDNDDYWRFCDRCHTAGITVPLIPGILPVTNLGQIRRITALCGAKLPPAFLQRLSERDDADWQFQVGVELAISQTAGLLSGGAPGLHYYVLNRSEATSQVLAAVHGRFSEA